MSGQKEHKSTFRLGNTRVTTLLPQDHPVYKGVMEARELLGGDFPEHVASIRILPNTVRSPKKDYVVAGRCYPSSRGGSRIEIYAGSIAETVDSFLVSPRTTNVTLHEVGHSTRVDEEQKGAWLDGMPSRKWEEDDAEKFVTDTRQEHYRKMRAGRPVLTFRQIMEMKRNLQEGE